MPDPFRSISEPLRNYHVILWDGECGFCQRSVDWLLKRTAGKVVALPYQQQSSWLPPEIFADCRNRFYLRTLQGKYLAGGDALIVLLNLMGWKTSSRILGLPGFRILTRLAYGLVARNRSFFSRILFRPK